MFLKPEDLIMGEGYPENDPGGFLTFLLLARIQKANPLCEAAKKQTGLQRVSDETGDVFGISPFKNLTNYGSNQEQQQQQQQQQHE